MDKLIKLTKLDSANLNAKVPKFEASGSDYFTTVRPQVEFRLTSRYPRLEGAPEDSIKDFIERMTMHYGRWNLTVKFEISDSEGLIDDEVESESEKTETADTPVIEPETEPEITPEPAPNEEPKVETEEPEETPAQRKAREKAEKAAAKKAEAEAEKLAEMEEAK